MKFYCLKNMHWFLPIIPKIYWNKKIYKWTVLFDESCKYKLPNNDQLDWNKLVGVSTSFNPRKNSIRFGWRYNPTTSTLEVASYCEQNKIFKTQYMGDIKPNIPIELTIILQPYCSILKVNDVSHTVPNIITNTITIKTNPYFGGNQKSPKFMSLKIWKRKNI